MRKVFGKFGKDLGCNLETKNGNVKRVGLITPSSYEKQHILKRSNRDKDPYKTLATK